MTEIPRKYLLGFVIVTIVVLVTTLVADPGSLVFRDNTDYDAQRKLAEDQTAQYEALLASVEPNYQASQQLLEKIASEDLVKQEVESTLNVNQKIIVPTLANTDLNISSTNTRPAMVDYTSKVGSMVSNYNQEVQPKISTAYADVLGTNVTTDAANRTRTLADNLRSLSVPQDAVELHKAYIVAYDAYAKFLAGSKDYTSTADSGPWSQAYGQYALIDNRLTAASNELNRLNSKYALNVPFPEDLAQNPYTEQSGGDGFELIKTANAQFGAWLTIDIEAVVREGIKAGLASAFAKFAIKMLDKLVAHIEKSFAIASQLYYSQDLGRFYSIEYMKKFVQDPLEQDIIQKFLPQYFCVNPSAGELKQIFTAKAAANQGTDIVIDPSDPDYLNKLARLGGDEKNYPSWWEDYYTTLAAQTQREAETAATKEVISPGLKSGRDLITGQINKTMASIFNTQSAAINGTINLGTNNAENIAAQIVATIVESMVNKFVFTPLGGGTSAGGGGISVIAEQNVCLKVPKIKPVTSLPQSAYENVPSSSSSTIPTSNPTASPPINGIR